MTATRITFSTDQSKMTVGTAEGGAQSFNIDDISTIVFTLDSAVDTPATEAGSLTIASQGAMVTISGTSEIKYMTAETSGRIHFAGKPTSASNSTSGLSPPESTSSEPTLQFSISASAQTIRT